jgi:hypothetical protein
MAAGDLPGFLGIHEIIGVPGQGYERPDDPTLPYVLLSGDELLHLVSIAQVKRPGVPAVLHADLPGGPGNPRDVDPNCPICASLFGEGGKLPALLESTR